MDKQAAIIDNDGIWIKTDDDLAALVQTSRYPQVFKRKGLQVMPGTSAFLVGNNGLARVNSGFITKSPGYIFLARLGEFSGDISWGKLQIRIKMVFDFLSRESFDNYCNEFFSDGEQNLKKGRLLHFLQQKLEEICNANSENEEDAIIVFQQLLPIALARYGIKARLPLEFKRKKANFQTHEPEEINSVPVSLPLFPDPEKPLLLVERMDKKTHRRRIIILEKNRIFLGKSSSEIRMKQYLQMKNLYDDRTQIMLLSKIDSTLGRTLPTARIIFNGDDARVYVGWPNMDTSDQVEFFDSYSIPIPPTGLALKGFEKIRISGKQMDFITYISSIKGFDREVDQSNIEILENWSLWLLAGIGWLRRGDRHKALSSFQKAVQQSYPGNWNHRICEYIKNIGG
jgi:tetratricopeptide (TPR) repeat protein